MAEFSSYCTECHGTKLTDGKVYAALITLQEAAGHLGIPVQFLREQIKLGAVETHNIFGKVRISEDEVIRLIEETRQPATSSIRESQEILARLATDDDFYNEVAQMSDNA